jgi:hypothetical protein
MNVSGEALVRQHRPNGTGTSEITLLPDILRAGQNDGNDPANFKSFLPVSTREFLLPLRVEKCATALLQQVVDLLGDQLVLRQKRERNVILKWVVHDTSKPFYDFAVGPAAWRCSSSRACVASRIGRNRVNGPYVRQPKSEANYSRGPLAERVGIYAGMSARDRVRIMFSMFEREVSIELRERDVSAA